MAEDLSAAGLVAADFDMDEVIKQVAISESATQMGQPQRHFGNNTQLTEMGHDYSRIVPDDINLTQEIRHQNSHEKKDSTGRKLHHRPRTTQALYKPNKADYEDYLNRQ